MYISDNQGDIISQENPFRVALERSFSGHDTQTRSKGRHFEFLFRHLRLFLECS